VCTVSRYTSNEKGAQGQRVGLADAFSGHLYPDRFEGFNGKINHANELREKYQEALRAFEQKQKEKSAALGLSSRDFGLSQ
jgi:hypothetical protein